MDTTYTYSPNLYSAPIDCVDEDYRMRLLCRGALHLLRGIGAALMMPLEWLEYLRTRRPVRQRVAFSWILSLILYCGFFEIWTLSKAALADGRDRTGWILGSTLVVLIAGIWSGRMKTRFDRAPKVAFQETAFKKTMFQGMAFKGGGKHHGGGFHGGHGPHGSQHGSGHGHGPHGGSFGKGWRGQPETPPVPQPQFPQPQENQPQQQQQPPQQANVCIHNCPQCELPVCVRSGRPKQGRTL